jgi:hypothetical protein
MASPPDIERGGRRRRLERLERLVLDEAPSHRKRPCLLGILWELPPPVQVGLAVSLVANSLPELEKRHPRLGAMTAFLRAPAMGAAPTETDIGAWRVLLDGDGADKADLFLFSCAANIKDELAPGASTESVTLAAVEAAMAAIAARTARAWIENDPEAARDEQRLRDWLATRPDPAALFGTGLRRPMTRDPAARDENRRSWHAAVAWLQSQRLDDYAEITARQPLARCLRRTRGR